MEVSKVAVSNHRKNIRQSIESVKERRKGKPKGKEEENITLNKYQDVTFEIPNFGSGKITISSRF